MNKVECGTNLSSTGGHFSASQVSRPHFFIIQPLLTGADRGNRDTQSGTSLSLVYTGAKSGLKSSLVEILAVRAPRTLGRTPASSLRLTAYRQGKKVPNRYELHGCASFTATPINRFKKKKKK